MSENLERRESVHELELAKGHLKEIYEILSAQREEGDVAKYQEIKMVLEDLNKIDNVLDLKNALNLVIQENPDFERRLTDAQRQQLRLAEEAVKKFLNKI